MSDQQIPRLLAQMPLPDKVALCSGANFWQTKSMAAYGIPALFLCDGPHGLRRQEVNGPTDMLGINDSRPATCFPTAVTTGSSWDPQLLEDIGRAIGAEAQANQVDLVLGPGANLKRNPLCGRNFEYFSEDPMLTGKLAAALIRGIQHNGTGACLKHFALNNQEHCRFQSDSMVDPRTMRELYLTGFELAVREGQPAAVMCAYNKINGTHCSDSWELLTHILRQQWGFDGMVVTDWGAMNDRVQAFAAGCDLNMPGGSGYMERETLAALRSGALDSAAVDESAGRILALALNQPHRLEPPCSFDPQAHHDLARRAAEAGAVLLKNQDSLLPLREDQSIAVIGAMAKTPRYQGAGSSHINPTQLTAPLDYLPNTCYAPGCDDRGDTTQTLLDQAAAAAAQAQVALVFAGLPGHLESEGFDRKDMSMPQGHLQMIDTVASANPNTVVVLLCGSPVECPWADRVKAILYLGLPGQAGGEAAANLLYGRVNPCGKLAESWPMTYQDCPSAQCWGGQDAQYREGIYVGYRYYTSAQVPPRWPFGHGLSYTSFAYSDLKVDRHQVSVTVTNTGSVPGGEVAQLYVSPPAGGLHRPTLELKGFEKIFLQPGEHRIVTFPLTRRTFALWQGDWVIPGGTYTLRVGASSQDLPLSAALELDGPDLPVPAWQPGSWYQTLEGKPSQQEWEAMLGRSYTPTLPQKGQYTMDNSVMEMKSHSLVMKLVFAITEHTIAKSFGGKRDYSNPEFRLMLLASAGAPLRTMQIFSGFRGGLFPGLLDIANGHPLRGLIRMLRR